LAVLWQIFRNIEDSPPDFRFVGRLGTAECPNSYLLDAPSKHLKQ
jgi:hypothetical protein